jgi:hypothetical protein
MLTHLIGAFESDSTGNRSLIRDLLDHDRTLFYSCSIEILKTAGDSKGTQFLVALMVANDMLLQAMCDPALSREQAMALGRAALRVDPMAFSGFCSFLCRVATPAPGQEPLTDQQVARVIGRADKMKDSSICIGRAAAPDFRICLQGPEQRIVLATAIAKQEHHRLQPADVPAEVRAHTWSIIARPGQPALVNGRPVRTALAENLTVQVPGHPELSVKALDVAPLAVSWGNAVGVAVKGQGLTASVDASTLPPGDLDIVIVEDSGTARRYGLAQSVRAQIH